MVRNVAAHVVHHAMQFVVTFITFSYLINAFGRRDYGTYSLIWGVVLFFQFFNLGLNLSLMKYVSEYHARSQTALLLDSIRQSYLIAFIANTFVGAALVLVAFHGLSLLSIAPGQRDLFQGLALIVGGSTIVNGTLTVPRGVLAGLQRFDLRTKLDLVAIVGPVLGIAAIEFLGIGLIGFVVVAQGAVFVAGICMLIAIKILLPSSDSKLPFDAAGFRRLIRFNLIQVGNQVASILFYTSDRFILQRLYGPVEVANYAVAERPNRLADMLVSLPLGPLVPAGAEAYALERSQLVQTLLYRGSRMHIALVLPPILVLALLMQDFLRAWLGPEFSDIAPLAQMFLFAAVIAAPFRVFSEMMISKGRLREIVGSKVLYAPFNVVASWFLARRFGIVGVVLPSVIYTAAVFPAVCGRLMRKQGIDPRAWFRSVAPVLAVCLGGAFMVALIHPFVPLQNLVGFLAFLAASVILIGIGVAVFVFNDQERKVVLEVIKSVSGRGNNGRQSGS